MGDARSVFALTSKFPPLGSPLNFDADVKETTARHQCENRLRRVHDELKRVLPSEMISNWPRGYCPATEILCSSWDAPSSCVCTRLAIQLYSVGFGCKAGRGLTSSAHACMHTTKIRARGCSENNGRNVLHVYLQKSARLSRSKLQRKPENDDQVSRHWHLAWL